MKTKNFNTRAIHEGQTPEEKTGAVVPPIFQTTTYQQDVPGEHRGFEYTRADNPNFQNLEKALASLETGKFATVFGSGLGAETAVLSLLQGGDHVVSVDDLYGGTYRLFMQIFARFGLSFDFVDGSDPKNFEKALKKNTKLIWIESPTNPLLKIVDIKKVAAIARKKKIMLVVDNTFATPYFQQPLAMGADIVVHSTTKYIGGHSDVVGGMTVTNDATLAKGLKFARKAIGLNPSPFDCWLTQRGLKTLGLRMEQHQSNAKAVATFLRKHPKVAKVYYPGFGGMVSCEFKLSVAQTKKLISSFSLFTLAESLGGVESLVCHPATMTHASIPAAERKRIGVTDALVRFSVGIEDAEDLVADLKTILATF